MTLKSTDTQWVALEFSLIDCKTHWLKLFSGDAMPRRCSGRLHTLGFPSNNKTPESQFPSLAASSSSSPSITLLLQLYYYTDTDELAWGLLASTSSSSSGSSSLAGLHLLCARTPCKLRRASCRSNRGEREKQLGRVKKSFFLSLSLSTYLVS